MKTGFAKKAARIILVVLLALIWTQAPAAEMTDQEIRDYLVAKSPFKGSWSSGHPWSGTLAQRFWVKDGQLEGALTEWNYDTQRGMDYPIFRRRHKSRNRLDGRTTVGSSVPAPML